MRAAILSALLLCCLHSSAQRSEKKNILIIVSDDHAFQAISAYGKGIMQTPSIDRIAREGAVFNKAYCTNSLCGPSRAVILTGKYSHKNGFKDNHSKFNGDQDNFAKRLQQGGYQTAWIGKWHLESIPQGFDYWQVLPGQGAYYNPDFQVEGGKTIRREGYVTNVITDDAEAWMDKRDTTKPFMLVIGHKATHRNWLPDTADLGRFDKQVFTLPSTFYDKYDTRKAAASQDMTVEKTMRLDNDLKMISDSARKPMYARLNPAQREKVEAYYAGVEKDFRAQNLSGKALTEWKFQRYMKDYLSVAASLDRNIGRVLDYLDQHGLTENTLVVYLSDQGFYMGEHGWFDKRFMYEESFRTPMVARLPGVIKPGSQISEMVMNLDIAPTCLELAGIPVPDDVQGRSFYPVLKGDVRNWRKSMYYHYYEKGEHSVEPHFGISNGRYKLIRFYGKEDAWELFDLQKDPLELKNHFGEKGYETTTASMKKQLRDLIMQYGDTDALKIMEK